MPFQSEKQRRYMHANLPDIAKRWERDYAGGGRIPLSWGSGGLFGETIKWENLTEDQKKWVKENPDMHNVKIPADELKHGGFIPAHEAGIYGLNEGGRIGFFTGMREAEQEQKEEAHHGDVAHGPGGRFDQPSAPTTTTTPDDSGDDDKAASYVNWNIQEKYTGDEDLETIAEIDKRNALTRLKYDTNLTKNERQNLEVGLGLRKPKQPFNPLKWILGGAAVIASGGAALGLGGSKIVKTAQLIHNVNKVTNQMTYAYNLLHKTNFTREDLFHKIQDNAKKVKEENQKKMDVYNSLPDGHPEKIALSVELGIGKKKTPPRDGPDDDKTKQFDSSITIDAEDVNRKKMELAAYEARQQQKEDRSKQMAYWRMMMAPYMSAQGGRVPAGYNTGGLSNLFRLKNV